MEQSDERFMRRALDLAGSVPFTSPNPRVGAVVVREGRVVAEGFHRGAGTAHAEAVALDGIDATGATVYVNLEPCLHQGQTPPCAPALVGARVARVVAAVEDPDERVRGKGFAYLAHHGVEVVTGVLAQDARRINAAYIKHRETGRPLVTLKLALTLDGHLAASDRSARWITGEAARARVHVRRLECDAVLVGSGTVVADDPRLTVRAVDDPRQPIRVVVDASGRVAADAALFAEPGDVLMATTAACPHETQTDWKAAGAEIAVLPEKDGRVNLAALLELLGARQVLEIYCEGGARLATGLLAAELVDRLELHYGRVLVGGSGPRIEDIGVTTMSDAPRWKMLDVERLGDDVIVLLERADR
ncbi:MAG: bifunctional diaminohydroxyphosphoribosylaminopyrimidine deaminase/5-amino-6-(5-phosphoribosylamino)uracil reductase RibD [Actinomycetota bacterium]